MSRATLRTCVVMTVAVVAGMLTVTGPAAAAAGPAVTAVSPSSGRTAVGARVTVTGSGFTGVSGVAFGTVAASSISVVSATKLVVAAPAHDAGTVHVRVTTASGTSVATPADRYTFVATPSVLMLAPNAGELAGGTRVRLTGTNFSQVTAVLFGGTPGTAVTVASTTTLTVTAPQHAAGLVDVKVVTSGGPSWASAADRFTFSTLVPTEPQVPANAIGTFANLQGGMDCPVPGWCVAPGEYYDKAGHTPGLLETLAGGVWTATRARVPAGTDPISSKIVGLEDASCAVAGTCVVVGSYRGSDGPNVPLIESLAGGVWTPSVPPLPSDADPTNRNGAYLSAVACPTQQWCVAVGDYSATDGSAPGLLETLSGGVWTATRIDSPAAAGATVAVDLTSVACTAARDCVVVGGYADSAFVQWGLIAELAGGAWTVTTAPVLPDNALGRGPLKSLTCPAAGECAALGADFVPHSETPLAYVQSGGAWTVSAVPLPADAIASRQQAILQSLSCPAPGSCVAVGQYDSSTVSRTNDPTMEPTRGLIATLAGGAWSTASGAVVPGASVLRSVDCWAPGSCAAVGIQQFPRTPSLQATEGLVETLAGGVWTYGNAPVPSNGIAGTSYTVLRQVSCPSGVCEAEGEYTIYNDQPGLFEAWRN